MHSWPRPSPCCCVCHVPLLNGLLPCPTPCLFPTTCTSYSKAGEAEALDSELKEVKASLAELQGERDELASQLAATEAEAQNTADCLEQAK